MLGEDMRDVARALATESDQELDEERLAGFVLATVLVVVAEQAERQNSGKYGAFEFPVDEGGDDDDISPSSPE